MLYQVTGSNNCSGLALFSQYSETPFERPPYLPSKSSLSKGRVSHQESIKHSQIENVPLKVGLSKGEVSGEEVVGEEFYCTASKERSLS